MKEAKLPKVEETFLSKDAEFSLHFFWFRFKFLKFFLRQKEEDRDIVCVPADCNDVLNILM